MCGCKNKNLNNGNNQKTLNVTAAPKTIASEKQGIKKSREELIQMLRNRIKEATR